MIFREIKDFEMLEGVMSELCAYLSKNNVPDESVFDSKLVASELISNVLQHSDGIASLQSKICGDFVQLTVYSSVKFCPPEESHCSDVYAESGRGLFIVDSVSAERSVTADGGIKVLIKIDKKR